MKKIMQNYRLLLYLFIQCISLVPCAMNGMDEMEDILAELRAHRGQPPTSTTSRPALTPAGTRTGGLSSALREASPTAPRPPLAEPSVPSARPMARRFANYEDDEGPVSSSQRTGRSPAEQNAEYEKAVATGVTKEVAQASKRFARQKVAINEAVEAAIKKLQLLQKTAADPEEYDALIELYQDYGLALSDATYDQMLQQSANALTARKTKYALDMAANIEKKINPETVAKTQEAIKSLNTQIAAKQRELALPKGTLTPLSDGLKNQARLFAAQQQKALDTALKKLKTALKDQYPLAEKAIETLAKDTEGLADKEAELTLLQKYDGYLKAKKFRQAENIKSRSPDIDTDLQKMPQLERDITAAREQARKNQIPFYSMWKAARKHPVIAGIIVGVPILVFVLAFGASEEDKSSGGASELTVLKQRLTAMQIPLSQYTNDDFKKLLLLIKAAGRTPYNITNDQLKQFLTQISLRPDGATPDTVSQSSSSLSLAPAPLTPSTPPPPPPPPPLRPTNPYTSSTNPSSLYNF